MRRCKVPVLIDGRRVGKREVPYPLRLWTTLDGPVGIRTTIIFPRPTSLLGSTADPTQLTVAYNGPLILSRSSERLVFIIRPLRVKGSVGVRPPFFRIRRLD